MRLLVPLTDLDLRVLARHRERFASLGCTVMIGSESVIAICRDKTRLNEVLSKAGLSTIRTLSLQDFLAQPFYPCFVKPIRGSASIGTALIRNEQELQAHISTFGEMLLVQEYVPGAEFTIDVYRSREGKVLCVVPRQRLAVRSGEVEKAITVKDQGLIESATQLSNLLTDIWGVFCCQCKRDGQGQPRFFEVNPRFGGGATLSVAAGANLPLYVLQETLGMPVSAKVGEFVDRLLMLRYDRSVFVHVDDPSTLPGFSKPVFR